MTSTSKDPLTCQMRIPLCEEAKEWSLVVGIFRRVPTEEVNFWLMPQGRPRSDHELAREVLLEIQSVSQEPDMPSCRLDVLNILNNPQAVAVIISTYLSLLPKRDVESIQTIQSLRPQ